MVFLGDIEKSGIVFSLMKNRINVDGFKQELLSDNFGLASLPEEIWRPEMSLDVLETRYSEPTAMAEYDPVLRA
ncbi:hypothetical protein M1N89_01515 [Dehalococcoidia bacterium]|nr:hypothetical protein [Dehalococcoidia bacterium]